MRWIPAAAWAAVIFGVSSIAGSSLPGGYAWEGHFFEYSVLAALVMLATGEGPLFERALLAVSLASAYGVTDELHQMFVVLRTPDPLDWAVDTAGALLAVVTVAIVSSAGRRRPQ